jgi:hypothetical protein
VKLSVKDKEFLERLKVLLEAKELQIKLKEDGVKRFVLCQNYGDKIEAHFGMSRQGVSWRFHRLFNEIYVSSYVTIHFVETHFGTDLRKGAMEVAKERVALRKKVLSSGHFVTYRREGDHYEASPTG